MDLTPLSWLGCALVLAACGSGGKPPPSKIDSLADGEYELVVERAYRKRCGPLGAPHEPIPEGCYQPVTVSARHPISVTAGGTRVEIHGAAADGASIHGSIAGDRAELEFELGQGTFAGGRLRIDGAAAQGRPAELTVFGSGVPIISSERGLLMSR